MLWIIRDLMKPALSVVEMIPNVHRTPALAALRKAALDSRALSADDRELAFYDGPVALTSPIGARLLLDLYRAGRIKLKKPAVRHLPTLEAYVATEGAFRAEVARLIAEDDARHRRLADIAADPSLALPEELTPALIGRVIDVQLGRGAVGSVVIAGLTCHRSRAPAPADEAGRTWAEDRMLCWWTDAEGHRRGDAE